MSTLVIDRPAAAEGEVSAGRVFAALLRRDVRVAARELPAFLLRTTLQPVMFVIVFGYLLPRMGFMSRGYTSALLPGVLAVSLAMSAIQAVTLPMAIDFAATKEIEDRLLAPVPTWLVAVEKIVSGMIQGLVSAIIVLPLARLIMGPIPGLTLAHAGEVFAVALLGAAAFSSLGLVLGTAVSPQHIGMMFSVIVAPMIFFGCTYYPWRGLDAVPAVKYAVLVNPLVYVAEGMRAALTPALPHMPLPVVLAMLLVLTAGFGALGLRAFYKRAIG
ncbi:MAG TPA: ABC transporter permease [Longimicrobium sp.]|nr:ABC transporter permease [Longimicrobium sp.]